MQRVSAATVRGGVGVATAGTGGARPRTRCAARLARGASRGEVASNAAPPPAQTHAGRTRTSELRQAYWTVTLYSSFSRCRPRGKRGEGCVGTLSVP